MPSDTTPRAASAFIAPDETYASIGRDVSQIALAHPSRKRWWLAMGVAALLIGVFAASLGWLFWEGVGIWGNNIPVTWALDIVAYDWWIGVACGGMLTSATLVLLGVEWRSSINRITETMTVIAAAAAGAYPIIHLGRPWFFYWNLPYPNTLGLWPQFRSPLYWDAVDIISFLGVSLTFWYIGLLPDFAALRDRAFERAQAKQGSLLRAQIYGIAACGWRGSAAHWQRWTQTYRTLALLGVVVVVALQTGAAVMFAGTVEPGWHDTLQPVSFLFAALFAGLGVVAVLAVALRSVFALDALITERHLGVLASLLLGTGLIMAYCYASEFFYTLLKGDPFDIAVLSRRFGGSHAWAWWTILIGAVAAGAAFLVRRGAALARCSVRGRPACRGRHVGRPLHGDRRDVAARFPALSRAPLRDRLLGRRDFRRFGGRVPVPAAHVPALSAGGLHPGDAAAGARSIAEAAMTEVGQESEAPLWGVSAEFATPDGMLAAIHALRDRDLGRIDAFSPVPVAGLQDALRLPEKPVTRFAALGAAVGAVFMMGMCIYATAYDYVFDIGNRPRFSWQAFVVPTASFAMLTGAIAAWLAFFVLNRLPRLNHPAFNIPGIARATEDRFFVAVEARHERFDPPRIEAIMRTLGERPLGVHRVPR